MLAALACVVAGGAGCAPQKKPPLRRVAIRRPPPPPPIEYESPPAAYVPWGEHSVETRVAEIGPRVHRRWRPWFARAGVAYPPASVTLVAFKRERRVDVYAGPSPWSKTMVRSIAITAASGTPGPKLREGDRQVPEGVYSIESLNPNSSFHVALRLAYPNRFDQWMADRDGRRHLGGDIMIHGSDQSIGCIAVGDEAAEDLFVIAADAGIENVTVVIVPRDFRRTGETEVMPGQPEWVHELYAELALELRSLSGSAFRPQTYEHPDGRIDYNPTAR